MTFFLLFFPLSVDLVFVLSVSVWLFKSLLFGYADTISVKWKLFATLEAVSEPCARPSLHSGHRREWVLQLVSTNREIQWLQWSENTQEMHKGPNYALQHCWKWPKMHFCHLKWPTAVSGLECRKDSGEVMGKRVTWCDGQLLCFHLPPSPKQLNLQWIKTVQVFVIKPGYFHAEVTGFYWILLLLCLKMIMVLLDNGAANAVFWEEEGNKIHQCLVS